MYQKYNTKAIKYVQQKILQSALQDQMKAGRTSLKAKRWAGSARDSVDAIIEALVGKLSVKGARQQGVGDRSHHLLGATFRSQVLGIHHSFGEEE